MLTATKRTLESLSAEAHDYKIVLQEILPGIHADKSKLIEGVLAKHATSRGHVPNESKSASIIPSPELELRR
jgi:hypothetical protein